MLMENSLEEKKKTILERTPTFIELEETYEQKISDYEKVKKEVVCEYKYIKYTKHP